MDIPSANLLREFTDLIPSGTTVLDEGSFNVNGTCKENMPHCNVIGLDITEGPGVDVVGKEYEYPFEDNKFSYIVSANTMEHVKNPWRFIQEIYRMTSEGGKVVLLLPF